MYEEKPEDVGDLYLDMAEAFHENGYYHTSKPLLERLVHSDQFNLVRQLPPLPTLPDSQPDLS